MLMLLDEYEGTTVMPPKRSPSDNGVVSTTAGERVTMQDVARVAGVSNSSISNYINGNFQRLGPEARTRIGLAIAELGFRPNQAARQLKTGTSRGIALVVPSIVNPFNGQLVFAIEQAAVKAGYGVHLCNTMRDPKLEKDFLDNMVGVGLTNLITIAPLNARRGFYATRTDLSVVAIDALRTDLKLTRVDTVNLDHELAIKLAVEHLYGLGHRQIVYVTDSLITHSRVMRLSGFKKAMKERGLSETGVVLFGQDGNAPDIADAEMVDVGRYAATKVIALDPHPTAVIAFNDMIALGLLASFRANGISVPNDISLVGVDDVWVSQLSFPGLTTIRQPVEAMARAAIDRIVTSSSAPTGPGSDTMFLPELIVRETCARPLDRPSRIRKRPSG
jgi:DNA-binding LacI/PurR family transcriptional regulator